jgi:hypothetical protein
MTLKDFGRIPESAVKRRIKPTLYHLFHTIIEPPVYFQNDPLLQFVNTAGHRFFYFYCCSTNMQNANTFQGIVSRDWRGLLMVIFNFRAVFLFEILKIYGWPASHFHLPPPEGVRSGVQSALVAFFKGTSICLFIMHKRGERCDVVEIWPILKGSYSASAWLHCGIRRPLELCTLLDLLLPPVPQEPCAPALDIR